MKLIAENPYASATGLATFIVVILVYALSQFGINLPAEVIVAVTGVLSFLLGRWTRINATDAKVINVTNDTQKEAIIENAKKLQ